MKANTSAEAHLLKLKAKRQRMISEDRSSLGLSANHLGLMDADAKDAAANALLMLRDIPERGTGGELVPPTNRGLSGHEEAVMNPDYVSLEASISRVALADQCGVFDLAFDAAETIGAQDATEQMLAHQMAAAHKFALELLSKSARQKEPVEEARLVNASARLMDIYQKGMLTLNRIRTGGKQLVTVQHVQVADGAQAVIAGTLHTGGNHSGGKG